MKCPFPPHNSLPYCRRPPRSCGRARAAFWFQYGFSVVARIVLGILAIWLSRFSCLSISMFSHKSVNLVQSALFKFHCGMKERLLSVWKVVLETLGNGHFYGLQLTSVILDIFSVWCTFYFFIILKKSLFVSNVYILSFYLIKDFFLF